MSRKHSNANAGGGGSSSNGRGQYVKVDNLLNFQFAPSKEKLLSERDWREAARDHAPAPQPRRERIDPAAVRNAFLVQAFQFIIPRQTIGSDELRVALESWIAPWSSLAPAWSIVKYVVSRGPFDDQLCPICLEQPTAPMASTACGHIFCCACAYEFLAHHRDKQLALDKQQAQRGGPTNSPIVAGTQFFPPATVPGSRASVQSQHAPCPMCGKPLSLRGLVPAILLPTDATASVGNTVSFVPVRRSSRFKLTPYGAENSTHARICVESAATYAWTHAQVQQLSEQLDESMCQSLLAADAEERATRAWEDALEARSSGAPAHLSSHGASPPLGGLRSASSVVGSAATLPSNIPPDVKFARDAKHAADIQVEAKQHALEVFNELLNCESTDVEDNGTLDPAMIYMRDDFVFGDASPACHDEGEWTYQASDGRHLFLHPMLTKMLLDTSREGHNRQHTDPATDSPVAAPSTVTLPSRIDVKVQDVEHVDMQKGSRHCHRSFGFAPALATLFVVFGDIGNHVSHQVRARYRDAIQARQRKRNAMLRAEQRDADRAKERELAAAPPPSTAVPLAMAPNLLAGGYGSDGYGAGSSWEADSPPLTFATSNDVGRSPPTSSWGSRPKFQSLLDAGPSLEFSLPEQAQQQTPPASTPPLSSESLDATPSKQAAKPATAADWSALFQTKQSSGNSKGGRGGGGRGWAR